MAEARRTRRRGIAKDEVVRHTAELALELGVKLHLDADGGVSILGRLDSANDRAPSVGAGEDDVDEEIRRVREEIAAGATAPAARS